MLIYTHRLASGQACRAKTERIIEMAKNNLNIPVVEEIDTWVTVKKAAELMKVELPSTGAIIHDGRVKAIRIGGIFLVDKASATEFGKKREATALAEAAKKARAEKLEKLTNLTDEQLAKLLSQVEGDQTDSINQR